MAREHEEDCTATASSHCTCDAEFARRARNKELRKAQRSAGAEVVPPEFLEWWSTFSSAALSSAEVALAAFEAGRRAATPLRAEDLQPGDMFRKPNGQQVYVKLSSSNRGEVFGVNARGNTVTTRAIDEVVKIEDPQEWLRCKED